MPSPSLEKRLLSIPFAKGLSQKEDPRYVAPGGLLTGDNAQHTKTNVLGKRAGYASLPKTTVQPGPFRAAPIIGTGKRLGNDGGSVLLIAEDSWADAAWTFDEESRQWVLVDRVPEAYVLPDRTVAAHSDVIRELDTVVANGYEVHVYISADLPPDQQNNTGKAHITVKNATTGETVLASQVITGWNPNGGGISVEHAAPKLALLGNGVLIFGLMYGASLQGQAASGPPPPPYMASANIALWTIDMTKPWLGLQNPSAPLVIQNITLPPSLQDLGAWDLVAFPGNPNVFGLVYQQVVASVNTIQLAAYVANTAAQIPVLLGAQDVSPADAVYQGDGQPYIFGFGLELTTLEAAVTYGYVLPNGLLRVNVQLQSFPFFGTLATALNMMAPPALPPVNPLVMSPPHAIAISAIVGAYSTPGRFRIAFSPKYSEWDGQRSPGQQGSSNAMTLIYTVEPQAGAMVLSPGGAFLQQPRYTMGVAVASRWLPNVNGIGYLVCRLPSIEQGTYFLFADDAWQDVVSTNATYGAFPLRLVGTFAPRLSSMTFKDAANSVFFFQDQSQPKSLPHIVANTGAEGQLVYQTLISISQSPRTMCPTLVQWDMDSTLSCETDTLGVNTGIATGTPSLTDGVRVHEFAFPYYPSLTTVVPSVGGSLSAGSYGYLAIYDWMDGRGQIHRSGRSAAVSVPVQANGQCTITCTTMGFSGKEKALTAGGASAGTHGPQESIVSGRQCTIRLFRTLVDGTLYHEVASTPNLAGVDHVTFVDGAADTDVAENQLVYGDGLDGVVQGSILDNLCPPAFQALCVHKNRFFGVDGTNIWASKELLAGEGAGFNEGSAFTWDSGTGPIRGILSLDDKLVLWKDDAVAVVYGEGPTDNGGQNDWSPPQGVATDFGAIDWRSGVVKGDGVYFLSRAGLRMLTRDLQVVPVPHVEDVLDTNPVVTSAVIHPTMGRILITCNTDEVSVPRSGTIVDRDYVLDTWLTSTPRTSDGETNGAVSAVVADAVVAGELAATYHYLDAQGTVWRETPAAYFDSGSYVSLAVETAWIRADAIAGFAKFRRLLVTWQNQDPHQLIVSVAFDYGSTYYPMGTVTAAMMSAMTTPLCQQLFALPRQRAEAVRFRITDAQDTSTPPVTGQGPLLISLDLEVSVFTNKRSARLPPAQRS